MRLSLLKKKKLLHTPTRHTHPTQYMVDYTPLTVDYKCIFVNPP